jgi:hypothetical protein
MGSMRELSAAKAKGGQESRKRKGKGNERQKWKRKERKGNYLTIILRACMDTIYLFFFIFLHLLTCGSSYSFCSNLLNATSLLLLGKQLYYKQGRFLVMVTGWMDARWAMEEEVVAGMWIRQTKTLAALFYKQTHKQTNSLSLSLSLVLFGEMRMRI